MQGKAPRRLRWIIVSLVAACALLGTVAIGIAMTGSPDTVVLVLDGSNRYFEHDGGTQPLVYGNNQCSVTPASLSGPYMTVTAQTYDKKGRLVSPAPIGIVENGMGVNEKGNGNGQDCGRVDKLDGNLSEKLTLKLGPALAGRLIKTIEFDFEAKYNAIVKVSYFLGTTPKGSDTFNLSGGGSDSGPDAGARDKYTRTSTASELFDTVVITMDTGSVSLEGGADWGDPSAHRTVFTLQPGTPSVNIEATTNNAENPTVAAGSTVNWKYVVTNTGDYALGNVQVSDSIIGTVTGPDSGDSNGNGFLDLTETWIYTATGTASAGTYTNTGTVTADPPTGPPVSDTDGTGYFGAAPALSLSMSVTNGVGTQNYVAYPGTVNWRFDVTNTGNVALTNVAVSDSAGSTLSCPSNALSIGGSMTCTSSSATASGSQTNNGQATATGPAGNPTPATSSASYFGVIEGLVFTDISPDGEVIITGEPFTRTFTVTNTSNVPLSAVIVSEDGETVCDDWEVDGSPVTEIPAGATATCTSDPMTAEGGEQTTTYQLQGQGPLGAVPTPPADSEPISYFGGLDCGDDYIEGDDGLLDEPLARLFLGPLSKGEQDCAIPVEILTTNTTGEEGGEQTVTVGPPDGWAWENVTGLLTIYWDVEAPTLSGVARTYQRTEGPGGGDAVIPWCAEIVQYQLSSDGWSYELNPFQAYHLATGGGDTCLVFQGTGTVTYGGETVTQTYEIFYIYNDPILVRK